MIRTARYALLLFVTASIGTAQSPRAIAGMLKRPERPCTADSIPESTHTGRAWVDGIVPYLFASNVTAANRTRMLAAMAEWENVAAVQFVLRTTEPDWILIQDDTTNSSAVGRVGGRQVIRIYNWGLKFKMVHELCHALGFRHEHTRPDRDTYVRIETTNIKAGKGHNFTRQTAAKAWGAYDFDSVMHYSWNAFAINPALPTITVLPPNQAKQRTIGQRTHLSAGDIDGMRTVYGPVRTTRVSVTSTGTQGGSASTFPSISSSGRYVAFESTAGNLVPGDTNGVGDIFVHDRQTGTTTRVSVSSAGGQGNAASSRPSISSDGRHVAFESRATNLVAGDTNASRDIFVHDRQTGKTTRVSVSSSGGASNHHSYEPSVSATGRYVAFHSEARNLVAGDTNGAMDVFVHDLQTKKTTRISVASGGLQGNGYSYNPSISGDGRYVAFDSRASNLVVGDTNRSHDVFVRDRTTKRTTRVSVNSSGTQGNGVSTNPSISADGRHVAFKSSASNLVSGDTNRWNDIFNRDRLAGRTTRISLASDGTQGNASSFGASISADGRHVSFYSWASNLVTGDTNGQPDVFVCDRAVATLSRVSVSSTGAQGNLTSWAPASSADGRHVAFESQASNLVAGDTNGSADVFVRSRLSEPPGITSYGTACLGSVATPTIHARARARWEGNTQFAVHVSSGAAASPVLVGISLSNARIPIGRGCDLNIVIPQLTLLSATTDAWGTARLPLPVPTGSGYKGVRFFAQGFIGDPQGAWYGLALTEGLSIVVQ